MQKELRRINILQAGLFLGVFYAILGLVIGLMYGVMLLVMGAVGATAVGSGGAGSGAPGPGQMMAIMGGMGLFMIILIPVMYGAMGFVGGLISAALYNLIAKFVGGIKVEVVDIGPTPR